MTFLIYHFAQKHTNFKRLVDIHFGVVLFILFNITYSRTKAVPAGLALASIVFPSLTLPGASIP